jgi:hypothetical protein
MDERQLAIVEARLQEAAAEFRYPSIPDIRNKVLSGMKQSQVTRQLHTQKLAWTVMILAALMVGLLAVPPVRAQVVEFLQVGVVKIFQVQPGQTPAPTQNHEGTSPPAALIPSLQLIAGETDLQNAQERVQFPIQLPGYPADLGDPDRVFLQDMAGPLVVLVWMEPEVPEQVRLSLHIVGPGSYAIAKFMPPTLETTQVDGQLAIWAKGPYVLNMNNGTLENIRLIEGHVLIWEQGRLTYRLETDLPLEEAVRIAESLH